jgi:hypothetical protein
MRYTASRGIAKNEATQAGTSRHSAVIEPDGSSVEASAIG